MKAVVVFLILMGLAGAGFVMLDSWVLSDLPTHVIRVNQASLGKPK